MERENCSSLTEFIFLRISENIENKVTLFTMVLLVYLINLLANLGMITLIRMDTQLHTSMYFFLSHLSCSGLSISAAVGRKMLVDLFAKKKSILFCGCALQLLVLYTFADSECGKAQFSFWSQRRVMPKNVQNTVQLHSFHMLARQCSKFFKLSFNSMWNERFQMQKLELEKVEETESKLPTSIESHRE